MLGLAFPGHFGVLQLLDIVTGHQVVFWVSVYVTLELFGDECHSLKHIYQILAAKLVTQENEGSPPAHSAMPKVAWLNEHLDELVIRKEKSNLIHWNVLSDSDWVELSCTRVQLAISDSPLVKNSKNLCFHNLSRFRSILQDNQRRL